MPLSTRCRRIAFLSLFPFIITSYLFLQRFIDYANNPGSQFSWSSSSKHKRQEEISLNPDSTLSQDIERIFHDPKESAVYVHLKSDARCKQPSLRGRLSGPSLAILQWSRLTSEMSTTTNKTTTTTTVLKGEYKVPFSKKYFVEIIVLFCQEFVPRGRNEINGTESMLDANFNFSGTCVEDTWKHRVTATNASIQVTCVGAAKDLAHWVYRDMAVPTNETTASHNDNMVPMYTRFQPQGGCRGHAAAATKDRCKEKESTDRYEGYVFQWPREMNFSLQQLKQEKMTNICVVGWSHARSIVNTSLSTLPVEFSTLQINLTWSQATYPSDVNTAFVQSLISENGGCDKMIIGVGQWAAGFPGGRPWLFRKYYKQVTTMLSNLRKNFPSIQIFARSVHYNPLGDRISACPPRDWRNPDVIDGYNLIIQKACQELGGLAQNITHVDTNFIVAPLWDSAPDWCHLSRQVQVEEALYLVAVSLGVVNVYSE